MIHTRLGIAGALLIGAVAVGGEESLETTGVLQVPVQRQAALGLETAAAHLERGEYARAAGLLEAMWVDDRDELSGDDQLLTSLADRVVSLVSRFPETEQRQFWQRIEAAAGDRTDDRLLGSPTLAGLRAMERVAARLKDQGNFELAAAAYQRAAQHPAATPQDALRNQVLQVDLLAETSGPHAVQAWLSSVTPEVRDKPLLVANETITVGAWLTRNRGTGDSGTGAQAEGFPVPLSPVSLCPSLTPQLEWTAPAPGNLPQGLARAGDELRSQGLIRLSNVRPVVIGSRIVTRTLLGLACVDAESGQLVWELHNRQAADRAALAGQQNNPLFSGKLFSAVAQQFQTNTLVGAMAHDERAVYHVVETAATEPSKPFAGYSLEAVDVASGRRLWRAGGPTKSKDDTVREVDWRSRIAKNLSVCGPPLVLGNRLYLLTEQSSELVFLAVNAGSLEVEWAASIGELLPDASRAAPRTYTAAPLIWTGDSVVCVTNCGAVVALDPIGQQVRWIARYPIELWSVGRLDPTTLDPSPAASLRTWRDASIWHSAGRLVCTSPESPLLHVLDAATGRLIYDLPRDGGIKVLGNDGERILILEALAVRAHDLSTGAVSCGTVIGEVHGTGLLTNGRILQPLHDGSMAMLDVINGHRLPGATGVGHAAGNLVSLSDGWLSADEFRLRKFLDVRIAEKQPSEQALTRAEHQFAAGNFAAARQELSQSTDESAQRLARSIDLAELQFRPAQLDKLRDGVLDRSQTAAQKSEALFALAEAAKNEQRLDDAVQFALDGLDLDQTTLWTLPGEPLRRVRADRAFQGLISLALELADDTQRTAIEQQLVQRWQSARDLSDPFALQRLEHRWRSLDWSREHLADDAEAIFLGTSLIHRELALLAATRSLRDDTGLRIAWKLRDDWNMSGFARDAAALEWRLLRDSPGRIIADGKTVRQQLVASGTDLDRLLQDGQRGPADVWPAHPPRITATKDASDEAYQTMIPIEAEPDGVWDRVDVTVDRQGQILRFTGDDQSGAWKLTVPRGVSHLQQYPLTYQGWGCGRLLLVRLGTQLVAVSPWNEHGEPDARLLWSLDLLGPGAQLPEQLIVERQLSKWKRAHETFRIIDQFGRDVCLVGPVRPGYLCYLQQGKLIAIDTQTGQTLWERWDVAPGVIPWGDDRDIMLFSPSEGAYEVLSAQAGLSITQRKCESSRHEIWHVADGEIWAGEIGESLTLFCRDLADDRRLWERTFPHDCLPISLDGQTGAVVDPRGALHLIDMSTGATYDEPLAVELPRPIERLLISRDQSRWYLGVSGPVDRSFEWVKEQPVNAYRRPLLQGPLWAIDRASRQIIWQREVAGEPWLLDQNKSTPVLVQIHKVPPPMQGQGIGEGVLRLIDKRTGREVFHHRDLNLLPYVSLEPQQDYQKFEVRTNNTLFQAAYGPEDEE